MQQRSAAASLFLGALGVVFAVAGIYMLFGSNAVPVEDRQRCLANIEKIYTDNPAAKADFLTKCDDPGMVAMLDAQAGNARAKDAARAIASANRSDIATNVLSYGFIGFGAVLLIGSIAGFLQRRKA